MAYFGASNPLVSSRMDSATAEMLHRYSVVMGIILLFASLFANAYRIDRPSTRK